MTSLNRLIHVFPRFFSLLLAGLIIIGIQPNQANAALRIMSPSAQERVIEHLRLSVPQQYREAWLTAENLSWEKWLSQKTGFLGRELFWDPKSEEATLMISWASRADWKSISNEEIADVQERFEEIAREVTGQTRGNPFPLVFEGELFPQ